MLITAGGFVLGEVLILLRLITVWQSGLLSIAAAVLLFVWYHMKHSRSASGWLLFFCIPFLTGSVRTAFALDTVAASERAIAAADAPLVCGIVGEVSEMEGSYGNYIRIRLDRVRLYEDGRETDVGGLMVTLDDTVVSGGKQTFAQGQMSSLKQQSVMTQPTILSAGHFKIGMELSLEGTLQLYDLPRNPGEFHARNYYRAMGIHGKLKASSVECTDWRYSRWREALRQIRMTGTISLAQLAEQSKTGIFQAAVFGEKAELDGDIRDMYSRNGISHLLALSGLHLSLIVSVFYRLLRRCGAGFRMAGLVSTALTAAYAVMTGNPVSVIRASVMTVCGFAAACCGRKYDLLSAMGAAALLLLLYNPCLLYLGSFQLSFGAIMGIGLIYPVLCRDSGSYLSQALGISLSIQAVTLPITLFHYYQTPLYGTLLNLVAIPLMAFVVSSGLLGAAAGLIHPGLGRFAVGPGVWVLSLYETMCGLADKLPASVIITGQPGLIRLIIYSLGMFIFLICTRFCTQFCAYFRTHFQRHKHHRNTELLPAKHLSVCRPAMLILLQLFLCIRLPVSGLQATFLDVGQGDGICIRSGSYTILVDGGSSSVKSLGQYRLEPFLKQQGVSVIDYAYVSHGDTDHISGLVYLLEEGQDIRIRNLMLPAAGRAHPAYEALCTLTERQGGAVHWIGSGDIRQLGKLSISCLYPDPEVAVEDLNQQSLVMKASYGEFHMLLTGDMGMTEEADMLRNELVLAELTGIRLLKVAHHGSKYSTSDKWLAAMKPRWAVVSYGSDNRYGHPHESVLERLEEQDVTLFCTAESGAITLNTDGEIVRWRFYCQP